MIIRKSIIAIFILGLAGYALFYFSGCGAVVPASDPVESTTSTSMTSTTTSSTSTTTTTTTTTITLTVPTSWQEIDVDGVITHLRAVREQGQWVVVCGDNSVVKATNNNGASWSGMTENPTTESVQLNGISETGNKWYYLVGADGKAYASDVKPVKECLIGLCKQQGPMPT
ncbi:MAG: hypothetical protein ABH823_05310 [bacterium]